MSGVETFTMPNGTQVHYRDSQHSYWREFDGKKCSDRLAGISSISKIVDTNADPLLDWSARLSCEGVAREASLGLSLEDAEDMRTCLSWMESGPSIWEHLRDHKLTWRHIREEAGFRGYDAHEILRALAEGATPLHRTGYDHAVRDWWEKHKPTVIASEQVVCSLDDPAFAGRFDLLCEIAGRTHLLDLKTGSFAAGAWAIQLNLYGLAIKASGFPDPDHLGVLQVFEDGNWHLIDVPIRADWALSSIAAHQASKEVSAHMRSHKRQKVKAAA